MITPFAGPDEHVDHDAIARNVERWLGTPLTGLTLTSATGEEQTLLDDEKVEIVRTVSRVLGNRRFVIAGVDYPSAAPALHMAERYAEAGADMIRVRVPRGLSPEAFRSYYEEVVPRMPRPVLVIHQTFGAAHAAPPEVLASICEMDNVFGYLLGHDIMFEQLVVPLIPKGRVVWGPNARLLSAYAFMGATGSHMLLGNVAPGLCLDVLRLFQEGRYDEARKVQERINRVDGAMMAHGVSGVKAAVGLIGYETSPPRRPGKELTDDQLQSLRLVMDEAGLIA